MSDRSEPRLRRWVGALLRHRLLHFSLLGALLFALAPREEDPRRVDVDADEVVMVLQRESARRGRNLDLAERRAALDAYVEEEILFREGVRLDVHRSDPALRSRILQLMTDAAQLGVTQPVTERELDTLRAREPERWRPIETARFELCFVGQGGDTGRAEAERIATQLRAGAVPAGVEVRSETLPRSALASAHGPKLAELVFTCPLQEWSEPIPATYGFYLVRVLERRAGGAAEARVQRAELERAVLAERARQARRTFVARLAQQYRVRVEASRELVGDYRFAPETPLPVGESR